MEGISVAPSGSVAAGRSDVYLRLPIRARLNPIVAYWTDNAMSGSAESGLKPNQSSDVCPGPPPWTILSLVALRGRGRGPMVLQEETDDAY